MGSSFGKYRLIAELGRGGMADIFLGVAQGPKGFTKLVVLKRVLERLANDPTFASMLIDEARLAARLQHPNVVQTYEAGEIDGQYFIAMEYLEGQSLDRIIRRVRRSESLDPRVLYCVLIDALAGLQYAHELSDYDGTPLGVVHRDATPQNIFVTYDGQVKVVDFGIAKAARRTADATEAGVLKGKTAYMSPEQVLGRNLDGRCDVFAAGVMLWEMATGQRMWAGLDEVGILGRLLAKDVRRSPREVDPEVPLEIDRICQRALAPNVEDRYPSAGEMQQDLEQYLLSTGKRPSRREIGERITALFADKRAKIRSIIEEKLASLEESDSCEIETRLIHEPSGSVTGAQAPSPAPSTESLTPQDPGSLTVQFVATRAGQAAPKTRTSKALIAGIAATAVFAGVGALTVLRGPGEREATSTSSHPTGATVVEVATTTTTVAAAVPPPPSTVDATSATSATPTSATAQSTQASARPERPAEPRPPANGGTPTRTPTAAPAAPTTATAAPSTPTTITTTTTTTTPTIPPPGKPRRPIEYGDPLEE